MTSRLEKWLPSVPRVCVVLLLLVCWPGRWPKGQKKVSIYIQLSAKNNYEPTQTSSSNKLMPEYRSGPTLYYCRKLNQVQELKIDESVTWTPCYGLKHWVVLGRMWSESKWVTYQLMLWERPGSWLYRKTLLGKPIVFIVLTSEIGISQWKRKHLCDCSGWERGDLLANSVSVTGISMSG